MKTHFLLITTLILLSLAACDHEGKNRMYTSKDPEDCSRLRFVCTSGKEPFSDDTGCGCEATGTLPYERTEKDYDELQPIPSSDQPHPSDTQDSNEQEDKIRADEDPLEQNLDDAQDSRLNRE